MNITLNRNGKQGMVLLWILLIIIVIVVAIVIAGIVRMSKKMEKPFKPKWDDVRSDVEQFQDYVTAHMNELGISSMEGVSFQTTTLVAPAGYGTVEVSTNLVDWSDPIRVDLETFNNFQHPVPDTSEPMRFWRLKWILEDATQLSPP